MIDAFGRALAVMKHTVLVMVYILSCSNSFGQQEVDNSKPTNVYSQVDNFLEYVSAPGYHTIGYNPRLSYAPHENFSLVTEVPLRYHTGTKKFGLADIRLRAFYIPYRNYDKLFGSLGASIDVYAPTGNYDHGLGSSSWRISPGVIAGFILNQSQTISIFPNLSYIYTTEPTAASIPDDLREVDHGINFQLINSFILSEDAFVLITPIYDIKDLQDEREDEFILEVEPVIDIMQDRFQTGLFYRGEFRSRIHTISLYFTVFL